VTPASKPAPVVPAAMPFRSRTSLASGTGSSTKQDERPVSSLSVEKLGAIALSPLSKEEQGLPRPVTQRTASSLTSGRRKKKTRIDDSARGSGLRVHWDRFLRKMGTGTAPSSSSAVEESIGGSSVSNRRRGDIPDDANTPVDEVVVDREWGDELKESSATHSDMGNSPEKSGGSNHLGGTNTDRESLAIHADGFWGSCMPLVWLRWRLWPFLLGFFYTRFLDEKSEEHYNKENWFLRKARCTVLRALPPSSPPTEPRHVVRAVLRSQLGTCNGFRTQTPHAT
jgi:osomolarity two-component system, sensor histidine kinase SLN1